MWKVLQNWFRSNRCQSVSVKTPKTEIKQQTERELRMAEEGPTQRLRIFVKTYDFFSAFEVLSSFINL